MSREPIERDAETLAMFVEESLEAMVRMERALLASERGEARADLIAALFRDLHTIKGTSAFLAFDRITELSHAAEDLMAGLRDRELALTPACSTLLLAVVDALRAMITRTRDHGDEGDLDVAGLAARLRAALDTPASVPAVAAPAPPEARPAEPEGTVRVSVQVLDRLMNLMGELVLARNQMVQLARTARDGNVQTLGAAQRLGLVTSDLQEQIMKTRMQPIARVFERIPRMVRDVAQSTGRRVDCEIEGTSTELDRALIETIRDPILHIVRNAVDHGIEPEGQRLAAGKPATGRLVVRASHEAGMVCIEVEDDGRGMDPEKLRAHAQKRGLVTAAEAARLSEREALELVFRPGFSTAEQVTSISGRGVGMDVVRSQVERAGGQVELRSAVGRGTLIRLKMPLTLAIIPALLVRSGGQRFCIPQVNLLELVYLNEQQTSEGIEKVRDAEIYRLRGAILPVVRLGRVLGHDGAASAEPSGTSIVVVAVGKQRYGLIVDEILDTEEIVVKPLHPRLKRLACYAGATVLGDGGVALILEVAGVAGMAGVNVAARARDEEAAAAEPRRGGRRQSMLVFSAGDGAACAVPLAIVSRLEQIPARSLEVLGGQEVVQYRDRIMPIVRPERVAPLGPPPPPGDERQIVVFDFGQPVGMQVNAIIDVVETALDDEHGPSDIPGAQGTCVIMGRTTLVLDVYDIVRRLVPGWAREPDRPRARRPRVLFVDDAAAIRTVITTYLRAAGVDVVECASGESALATLRGAGPDEFDALVTDLEMPGVGGMGVIRAARHERPRLPVLVWTHHERTEVLDEARRAGAMAVVHKMQREQLVAALASVGAIGGEAAPARAAS